MKSTKSFTNSSALSAIPTIAALDTLTTKLAHTRALLLVGSDADFSSYHPSVQQDFLGATLECVEDIKNLIPDLEERM